MFNLCSEKTYDTSFFHGRVERVLIDDHNVPSLKQMLEFADKVSQFVFVFVFVFAHVFAHMKFVKIFTLPNIRAIFSCKLFENNVTAGKNFTRPPVVTNFNSSAVHLSSSLPQCVEP